MIFNQDIFDACFEVLISAGVARWTDIGLMRLREQMARSGYQEEFLKAFWAAWGAVSTWDIQQQRRVYERLASANCEVTACGT